MRLFVAEIHLFLGNILSFLHPFEAKFPKNEPPLLATARPLIPNSDVGGDEMAQDAEPR
jgi:hypothetical protein